MLPFVHVAQAGQLAVFGQLKRAIQPRATFQIARISLFLPPTSQIARSVALARVLL
jgi:hypothetical protein